MHAYLTFLPLQAGSIFRGEFQLMHFNALAAWLHDVWPAPERSNCDNSHNIAKPSTSDGIILSLCQSHWRMLSPGRGVEAPVPTTHHTVHEYCSVGTKKCSNDASRSRNRHAYRCCTVRHDGAYPVAQPDMCLHTQPIAAIGRSFRSSSPKQPSTIKVLPTASFAYACSDVHCASIP